MRQHTLYIGNCQDYLRTIQKPFFDVVYIDPPYNSKSNVAYNDFFLFEDYRQEFLETMMLIQRAMKEDAFIAVSVGQKSSSEWIRIMDEAFGRNNFIMLMPRLSRDGPIHKPDRFQRRNDYLLIYAKNWKECADLISLDKVSSLELTKSKYSNEEGDKDLAKYGHTTFRNPKPVSLVETILSWCNKKKIIFGDFFAGTGTSFEACIKHGKETGKEVYCVLCQNKEKVTEIMSIASMCYDRCDKVLKRYKCVEDELVVKRREDDDGLDDDFDEFYDEYYDEEEDDYDEED